MKPFDWQHGVFVGASMASENYCCRAGNVRRGAPAIPWLCCPSADTTWPTNFRHWLEMGKRIPRPPKFST